MLKALCFMSVLIRYSMLCVTPAKKHISLLCGSLVSDHHKSYSTISPKGRAVVVGKIHTKVLTLYEHSARHRFEILECSYKYVPLFVSNFLFERSKGALRCQHFF